MKAPYDEADANRQFDAALKKWNHLLARVTLGGDLSEDFKTQIMKAARARDRLGDLYRWVDDSRKAAYDARPHDALSRAEEAGLEARQAAYAEQLRALKDKARAEYDPLDPLSQYRRELELERGRRYENPRVVAPEDPRGMQVSMEYRGRTLLGDVVGHTVDPSGAMRLEVRHFNGEPWPISPWRDEVIDLRAARAAHGAKRPGRITMKADRLQEKLGAELLRGGLIELRGVTYRVGGFEGDDVVLWREPRAEKHERANNGPNDEEYPVVSDPVPAGQGHVQFDVVIDGVPTPWRQYGEATLATKRRSALGTEHESERNPGVDRRYLIEFEDAFGHPTYEPDASLSGSELADDLGIYEAEVDEWLGDLRVGQERTLDLGAQGSVTVKRSA